jgi:protein TonB
MKRKKSESANLEKKRSVFLQIGLISGLALTLVALESSTFTKDVENTHVVEMNNEIVMMPPNVVIEEPQEKKEEAREERSDEIEIVKKEPIVVKKKVLLPPKPKTKKTDSFVVFVPKFVEPKKVVEPILPIADVMPEFPGGLEELYKYLGSNMKYPPMARENGIQGKVFVSFVVEKDGSITQIKELRGIGGGCDKEAKRVVKKMPKWKAGEQNGIPVRVRYTLPVSFQLRTH